MFAPVLKYVPDELVEQPTKFQLKFTDSIALGMRWMVLLVLVVEGMMLRLAGEVDGCFESRAPP